MAGSALHVECNEYDDVGPGIYEIVTKDSAARVTAWFLAQLKDRAMSLPRQHATKYGADQNAVDGGGYIINLEKAGAERVSTSLKRRDKRLH